jgi:PAS domain S-box-containing protein
MYRIHGLEPGELEPSLETGRPFVQPDDWKLLGQISLKAETEGQAECEIRVITKQGEPRNVLVKINLLRDNEGKPHSLLGIIQDITERKIIEENLRQSEKLFRSLAEKSPETIFILEMPSYRPIYQNRDEFIGYTRDELQARGSVIFVMHPDEEQAVIEQWQKLLTGQIDQLEYRLQAKNGEWVWLQTRVAILAQNEDGSPAQIVSNSSIITERKQAEARLRQQTRRLHALAELSQLLAEVSQDYPKLLDTIVQHITEAIGDGCSISLVSANREWLELAAISGPDPQTTQAYLQLRKSQPLRVNEGTELAIEQVLATLKPEYREEAQKFPIYSRVTVPLKAQGRIIGVLTLSRYRPGLPYTLEDQAFLQDLADRAALAIANARLYATLAKELIDRTQIQAERENLIDELEAKNAELERFTYTVSHDLKSPLITIRGFLGYLEKDAISGNIERLRKDIERISDATAKMQRLLNELLELSRIGRLTNPPEELAFESVVREALALTQGQLSARGVTVEIAEDLPRIYGDRVRLVEVVQNLIDNAIKFMGSQTGPCINIGSKKEPGDKSQNVTFFVQDNGIGIEPQFQEKVFGLFDKLDPRSDGTGVGLALVKRIVEIHGGRIWVESAGLGSGTTFYFTLPHQPAVVK